MFLTCELPPALVGSAAVTTVVSGTACHLPSHLQPKQRHLIKILASSAVNCTVAMASALVVDHWLSISKGSSADSGRTVVEVAGHCGKCTIVLWLYDIQVNLMYTTYSLSIVQGCTSFLTARLAMRGVGARRAIPASTAHA